MASSDKVSSPEVEASSKGNKYGGIAPKKKPLISKDRRRAFFDSADWALDKGAAEESKSTAESLQPKLQRTPRQQLPPRKPTCTSVNASSE
ncbi:unnamed protein product [Victoria cruziana]